MGYAGMDYDTFANTRLRDVPYEVFEAYKDRLPELWCRRAEHYLSLIHISADLHSGQHRPRENRFCPNIAIASFLLINLSHNPTQFLYQYLGRHKERIGSCTCPLAVTPPSWSRFLPVQHFCHPKRSVAHSSGKKI